LAKGAGNFHNLYGQPIYLPGYHLYVPKSKSMNDHLEKVRSVSVPESEFPVSCVKNNYKPPAVEFVNPGLRPEDLDIKVVVWDWDNTIQESGDFIDELEIELFIEMIYGESVQPEGAAAVRTYINEHHVTLRELFSWATDQRSVEQSAASELEWEAFLAHYTERALALFVKIESDWESTIPLIPGISEILGGLKKKNIQMVVATSVLESIKIPQAEMTGLNRFFQAIWGAESKTFPGGDYSKANVVRWLKEQRGLERHQIAIIGDGSSDIQGGLDGGAIAIGFARTPRKAQQHREGKADILIHGDFSRAEEILEALRITQQDDQNLDPRVVEIAI